MMKANILILKEKHGTYYLDASSRDAFLAACLLTVKRRVDENWFYHSWNPDEVIQPDLEEEVVRGLPDSETKTDLLEAWENYRKELVRVEHNNDIVELAELAAKTDDPYLAWYVLTERKNHEYEGFELEQLEAPLGIQHIQQRPKMKPTFSVTEAEQMLIRKLKTENVAASEASERRFRNLSSEEFTLGGVLFGAKDKLTAERTVPRDAVDKAEADGRLEKVQVDPGRVRLWNIESIHCLDGEDMVFSFWRKGQEGKKIRPVLVHVYKNGELKRLDITHFISPFGLTGNEWAKMGLAQD